MRGSTAALALALGAGLLLAPATAPAASKADALRECALQIRQRHEAVRLENVEVNEERRQIWVTGDALFEGERPVDFRCRYEYGRVRTLGFRLPGAHSWQTRPPAFVAGPRPETVPEPAAPTAGRRVIRMNWGESYSPAEGITCYEKRAACYGADDRMDLRWTGREFPSR